MIDAITVIEYYNIFGFDSRVQFRVWLDDGTFQHQTDKLVQCIAAANLYRQLDILRHELTTLKGGAING